MKGKQKLKKQQEEQERIQNELDYGPGLQAVECAQRISSKVQFDHSSLASPDSEIRLFELRAAAAVDNIELALRTFEFDECPGYTAVSYVWGNPAKCRVIKINGLAFSTTTNAYYALQQAINQHRQNFLRTTWFWLDSICIHQDNLDEKGKQVYLMGDIYERATEVLACVGFHADNSALVMEIFRNADITRSSDDTWLAYERQKFKKYWSGVDKMWNGLMIAMNAKWQDCWGLAPAIPFDEFWSIFTSAVFDFLNRPYWHRIWIVQEVLLASRVRLLCGSDSLDLRCIAPCLKHDILNKRSWACTWARSKMFAVLKQSHHTGECARVGPMIALHAFENLQDNECTDFRDRVYALLRVMVWGIRGTGIDIRPDYAITELGLVRQVALDIAQFPGRIPMVWWCTLGSLYRTLRLSIDSPEISELVNQRQAVGELPTVTANNKEPLSLKGPIVDCTLLHGFRLEFSADGLAVPGSSDGPSDSTAGCEWRSSPKLPDIRTQKFRINGECRGWTCPNALPGDYLISHVGAPAEAEWSMPPLIVRRVENHSSPVFKIIGHAVFHRDSGLHHGIPNRRCFDLNFEFDDFVTLIALWTHLQSNRDTVDSPRTHSQSYVYTPATLESYLRTSPTRIEYSSWSLLNEDRKTGP